MLKNTRRQPQRVPPPLLTGNERVEGQGILDELSGEEALVLWKTYRAVALWSQIRPRQRKELLSSEAFQARADHLAQADGLAEVLPAVDALGDLFRKTLTAQSVAARCRTIEEWADARGATRTAVEFAQLAAVAVPGDAPAAAKVARRVRDLADYPRAESWYWEAIVRARRAGDWQAYVLSALGLGITGMLRGNYPAARRYLERGLRRARRQGLTMQEAMAYHELTGLAIRTDNLPQTVQYGRSALRLYGPDHPRVPWLAHDLAVFWMNRGYFAVGLDVVTAIPADLGTATDQLMREANIVRAAGVLGRVTVFENAFARVETLLLNPSTASRAAGAMLDVGRGALVLGRFQTATEVALRAREMATVQGEGEILLDADRLLQEIDAAGVAYRVKANRAPRKVLEFASELVESLVPATVG